MADLLFAFNLEQAKKNPSRVRHNAPRSAPPNHVFFLNDRDDGAILCWNTATATVPSVGWYPDYTLRLTSDPDQLHPWNAVTFFSEVGQWEVVPAEFRGPILGRCGAPILKLDGSLTYPDNWLGMRRVKMLKDGL